MAYNFHYTPTGTGVISGKEVLEQTEDAINDLGNTAISGVQEALDKAEQALTNSENAVDDAQTALNTANNAEGVAIQAQTDVSNLSGTVTNIGNRVTTAEGNITNLQGRMTTAEGNITNLQGRMTTAETNIGNLQTAVSTAQATANSAQQTATTARQQSYVFRYSGTAVVPNSTIAYSTIDNTDNIKAGDKILDVDGKLFEITAVDTTNQTVTVGTALIDLANDSDVVHKSGNETVSGVKIFSSTIRSTGYPNIRIYVPDDEWNVQPVDTKQSEIRFTDKNSVIISYFAFQHRNDASEPFRTCWRQPRLDGTSNYYSVNFNNLGEFYPENNAIKLGTSTKRWASIYATNYYYGNDNVEFSTKFVTTDTNQTISGNKTFSNNVNIYNSDTSASTPNFTLRSSKSAIGTSDTDVQTIFFSDKNGTSLASVKAQNFTGATYLVNSVNAKDTNDQIIEASTSLYIMNNGRKVFRANADNDIFLGYSLQKWKDFYTYLINGLTPSSLGMPVIDRTKYVDISGYFTNTGNGGINTYSVTANGWIYLRLTDIGGCQLSVLDSSNNRLYGSTSSGNLEQLCLPVTAGTVVETQWTTSTSVTVAIARFIPCQGNI